MHLPHGSMPKQLLSIFPEQLLPHLRLELDLDRLEVPQPALRRNKRIIRPKEKPVL